MTEKGNARSKAYAAILEYNLDIMSEEEFIAATTIDWDSMPEHVKADLGRAALEGFLEFMKRPDAEELLAAKEEQLRREGSTLFDRRDTKRKVEVRLK